MESPLLYLTLCSLRNRLRVRLRRLREPRYLIGSIVGIGYLYIFFLRPRSRSGGARVPGALDLMQRARPAIELGAAGLLLLFMALEWLWPVPRKPALAFSRSDVQMLFTAPIPRRRLVRYKVLRSQLATVVSSGVMTLFFRPGGFVDGWTFFVGLTLVLATVNLHVTGISLSGAGPALSGRAGLVRRWLPRAIVALVFGVLGGTLALHWADLAATAARGGSVWSELQRLASTGAAGVVLWPFRAIVRLPLSPSTAEFFMALPWTLAALVLSYMWVIRIDVPFEEASAELSEKLAKIRQGGALAPRRPRGGAVATPFTLPLEGRAETAILWKNLILMGRFLSWQTLVRLAPIFILFTVLLTGAARRGAVTVALGAISLGIAAFTVVVGPQIGRSDLRHDLASLAVLKTWPVRGAALVRGEVLAPALVLTVIASLALIAGAVLASPEFVPRLADRAAYLTAALLVAPGLIAAQLLLQNALVVTFPSWVGTGPQRGGIDVMGQRLLVMAVMLLGLVLVMVPAAIVAGVAGLAYYGIVGIVPVVLPGLLAGGTLIVEALAASEMVGAILDRTDITAVDAPDT
jgi:hypothetical protein